MTWMAQINKQGMAGRCKPIQKCKHAKSEKDELELELLGVRSQREPERRSGARDTVAGQLQKHHGYTTSYLVEQRVCRATLASMGLG
jgi:hypothetical protein